jgi:hypothetical protein
LGGFGEREEGGGRVLERGEKSIVDLIIESELVRAQLLTHACSLPARVEAQPHHIVKRYGECIHDCFRQVVRRICHPKYVPILLLLYVYYILHELIVSWTSPQNPQITSFKPEPS